MAIANVLIIQTPRASDPDRDKCVHSMHFQSQFDPVTTTQWQDFADKIKTTFFNTTAGGGSGFVIYGGRKGEIRVYDRADAKPRPQKAVSIYTPTTFESSALGPREVALCLSYYAVRNTKRNRGRAYIGPFLQTQVLERPDATVLGRVLDLGNQLGVGLTCPGQVWTHGIWSTMDVQFKQATNYWVNDLWDGVKPREPKEMTRVHWP